MSLTNSGLFYFYIICSIFLINISLITNINASSLPNLILRAGNTNNAKFTLGTSNDFFTFVHKGQFQDFSINYMDKPLLSINRSNDILFFSPVINFEKNLTISSGYKVRGVNQWILVVNEEFSSGASGWSNNIISSCGGVTMLGGYCNFAGIEVSKTFKELPPHSYLRIEANYHFIDAWNGETGYMKLNIGKDNELVYTWVESYSAVSGEKGINVCGGRWAEGKFSSPIDITIPHEGKDLTIAFGSTLEQDACVESFGFSSLKIFIK